MCVQMFICVYACRINMISIKILWKSNVVTYTYKLSHNGTKIDDMAGIGNIFPVICMQLCVFVRMFERMYVRHINLLPV